MGVFHSLPRGWSGSAMVLGELPVPGRPTNFDSSRARPTTLAVGAGGGCLDIFTLIYPFLSSLSLGDGPIYTEILSQRAVKPKTNQPTNPLTDSFSIIFCIMVFRPSRIFHLF